MRVWVRELSKGLSWFIATAAQAALVRRKKHRKKIHSMRLSEQAAEAIVDAVRAADPKSEVWLYGSRVDDTARSGDIDVLVISDTLTFGDIVRLRRVILDRIGWQQLDLTVRRRDQLSDPFVMLCMTNGVKL